MWLTLGRALWGDQTLALNLNDIQVPGYKKMQTDGVFDEVSIIPGIYSQNVYGKAMQGLQRQLKDQAKVINFAYDWRKDIVSSAQKLHELVERLYSDGAKNVSIVAHSMGGLVASYYLIYGEQKLESAIANFSGADKIKKTVIVGTPYKGTMHVFRNMQFGISAGLNDEALKAHAISSFPSSYTLLPYYEKALLNKSKQDHSKLIFNPEIWNKHGWGLLSNQQELSKKVVENRKIFTKNMLNQAQKFNKAIHNYNFKSQAPTKLLFYIGKKNKMINQAIVTPDYRLLFPNKNLNEEEYQISSLLLEGDNTVTYQSAQPPEAFYKSFSSLKIEERSHEHLELINDEQNLKEISEFLTN
ncbi:MAG: hypothetical protein MK008_13385 [Bdellovibrionales bacterium]|nr:hypothetical protein [Bdellovibrionales bacterium]